MYGAVDYMFDNLKEIRTAIKNTQKTLKRQSNFNQNIALLALGVATYMVLNELDKRRQNEKIRELERKLSYKPQKENK